MSKFFLSCACLTRKQASRFGNKPDSRGPRPLRNDGASASLTNLYLKTIAVGTVVWTAPDAQTCTTRPRSRLLLPALCVPTAPVVTTGAQPITNAGLTMPRRDRIRAEGRRQRIDDERRLNEAEALAAVVSLRSTPRWPRRRGVP